jgi:Skp family chaperone for outer membrane proteins
MLFQRTVRAALAVCVAAVLCAAQPAQAGRKPPPATGPAWVDLPRVLAEYKKTAAFAKYQAKLRDLGRQFTEEMKTLAELRYCTDAERDEALKLKAKEKRTPAEQARMDELMGRADKVDNEISTLSQKQNPTEADTKRLQEISKMRTDALRGLAKAEADRRDQMRKLEVESTEAVENELLTLVEKVAKDQKLDIVYERRSVLFGGQDISELVIKKLPK